MDISRLLRIEYHGELVLTTKQIADGYECSVDIIRWNFAKNKDKFVEGVHYFKLEGAALREFKEYLAKVMAQNNDVDEIDAAFSPLASSLYLWTKEGVVRHCKLIGTQEAWNVFAKLEKAYFQSVAEPTLNRVYAMELDDNTVKIGRSSNVEARLKQIESENGVKVLRVYNTDFLPLEIAQQIENACHKFFAEFLAHGDEYFHISFTDACNVIDKFVNEIHTPQSPPIEFSPLDKLNRLEKWIDLCQDLNLRDDLIRIALNILKSA